MWDSDNNSIMTTLHISPVYISNQTNWELILPTGVALSIISITLRIYTDTNMTYQTIACFNPHPNQKNLKVGPRIPNTNAKDYTIRKGRLTVDFVLGL